MWPIPLTGMLGIAGSASFALGNGVFLEKMTTEFGWSRAEFSSGFTIHMLIYLIVSPIVGRFVDRFGPRRILLIGIIPFALAYSALGLANGVLAQWWLLCGILALAIAFVSSAIWVTAVVSRFSSARGGALAVTLAGMSLSNILAPLCSAYLIESIGWRNAFAAFISCWALVVLWLTYHFIYSGSDLLNERSSDITQASTPEKQAGKVRDVLLSRTFVCLILAGALFSFIALGMTVHLVPILQLSGIDLSTAAGIASAAGITNLIGQLASGFLVDKLSTKIIGVTAFVLPLATATLLILAKGNLSFAIAAILILGLAIGTQTSIVTYVASKRLPTNIFGSAYATMIAIFAVSASLGPLAAAKMFDLSNSYDAYLAAIGVISVISAVLFSFATAKERTG